MYLNLHLAYEATDSTYLTPLIDVDVTGGNPNASSLDDTFSMNLGGLNYEYQDGYFKIPTYHKY